MTHDALKRYLESAPSLAELASVLLPGVDSDSLINLHAGCAQPDSAILAQSFLLANKQEKTAPRITLAIRLHSFLLSEKEAARLAKNCGSDLQSCRSTAATPSTHIEACMTMSVRRRRATLNALVTSVVAPPPIGLEDPEMARYGRQLGGGRGVWHRAAGRASSRSGGV